MDAICRHVLAQEPADGELEARITVVCRNLYGDEHRAAARAVLNAVESHAERAGVSRLEAVADLARGQAEVRVARQAWSSLDEVPPELRERFRQMARDGKPGTVTRQRTVHWDAADGPPDEEVAGFPFGADTYVVIVTRGHQHDAEALAACLRRPAAYVGMIGSRRKVALMRQDFVRSGRATAEELGRVYAPIGLDVGAVTVPEIATSIVAQLIAVRRKGSAPRMPTE